MPKSIDPFDTRRLPPDKIAGVDYILVNGNLNIDKDKGQGQLLLTRSSVFAFRSMTSAATMAGVHRGLIGALIGYFIDKQRAKKRPPPTHLEDPEIQSLGEALTKKVAGARLLTKVPLSRDLNIERTHLGFTFKHNDDSPILYQGFFSKNKITDFLALSGFDIR